MLRKTRLFLFFQTCMLVLGVASFALGQGGFDGGDQGGGRGGFRGGPPGGGGFGGGGPPGGGFDPSSFITRMDTNGNGSLDPDEISDRARGFLVPRLQQAGIDTSKPIPMTKITEAFQQMRTPDAQPVSAVTKPAIPLVADFTSVEANVPLVPDFSLPDDSPLLQSGPLEDRYDAQVLERLNGTMARYDRNSDGVLDAEEIRGGRWSDDVTQYDLNKDGRLTKVELAERYKARNAEQGSRGGPPGFGGGPPGFGGGPPGFGGPPPAPGGENKESSRSSDRKSSSSNTSSSSRSTSRRSSSSSKEDKVKEYAASMLKKYDGDSSGVLEESEWTEMKGSPEKTDTNGDKLITLDELIVAFGGTPGGSTSSSSKSRNSPVTARIGGGNRVSTLSEKLKDQGVSSKFISSDKNADGNLQMSEYSDTWTDKILAEFDELDANRDGVISPTEWVAGGGR